MPKLSVVEINYTKSGEDESTPRSIIPMGDVVPKNLKALDVTDLDDEAKSAVLNAMSEYQEYIALQRAKEFSFQDWADHVGLECAEDIKWRTFARSGIEIFE